MDPGIGTNLTNLFSNMRRHPQLLIILIQHSHACNKPLLSISKSKISKLYPNMHENLTLCIWVQRWCKDTMYNRPACQIINIITTSPKDQNSIFDHLLHLTSKLHRVCSIILSMHYLSKEFILCIIIFMSIAQFYSKKYQNCPSHA